MIVLHEQIIKDESGRAVAVVIPAAEFELLKAQLAQVESLLQLMSEALPVEAVEMETIMNFRALSLSGLREQMTWAITEAQLLSLSLAAESLDEKDEAEEVALAEMGIGEYAAGLDDDIVIGEAHHAR